MSESDDDRPPPWDQEKADWLIGKYVLVGMTYYAADGVTVEPVAQYHGRIVSADCERGFLIACEGRWKGQTMGLPPFSGAFEKASPGEYKLKSTDEVVIDPDVLATWALHPPKN